MTVCFLLLCLLHSLQRELHTSEAGRLFYEAGHYLLERGRYTEAGRFLKQSLFIRDQQQKHDPIAFADSLQMLATLLWQRGNYEAAQVFYQQAQVLYERHMTPGHPESPGSW